MIFRLTKSLKVMTEIRLASPHCIAAELDALLPAVLNRAFKGEL